MEKLSDIQEELKGLQSPLLQLITNYNVFKVPEGYFEAFPLRVLGTLEMDAASAEIPADYFSEFSGRMLARVKEEDAVNEVDAVTEEFELIAPTISDLSRDNVFTLPAAYFADFSGKLLARIKAEGENEVEAEINLLSSVVAKIGRENVYTVPVGYFENLSNIIKPTAKVVRMGRIPAVVRYMVAAAFAGLLGLSLYTFVNKNEDVPNHAPVVLAEAQKLLEANSLDAAFENISEEEIENYLVANGHDVNAAIAASAINNDDLPNPLDYLIDENTLADYLKIDKQIN